MHRLLRFLGTTFVGGLLVILPVYLAVLLLAKAVGSLVGLLKPVVELVPDNKLHPNLIATVVVVVACFLAGLVAREFPKSNLGQTFEEKVLDRIPGYGLLRSLTRSLFGNRDGGLEMALVEMEDGLVVGVVIERHAVGWVTVFIPATPAPASGATFIFPEKKVHPVDVPFRTGIKAAAKYGRGAGAMLAGLKDRSILKAS